MPTTSLGRIRETWSLEYKLPSATWRHVALADRHGLDGLLAVDVELLRYLQKFRKTYMV